MENKFNKFKTDLDNSVSPEEVQDIIFEIAQEKIEVAKQDNKELIYAETSYLYQLERYANRKIVELSNERLGYLNLFLIESRRVLEKDIFKRIKENTFAKMKINN